MCNSNVGNIGLLFMAKGVRTFCYGFLGVLFPVYLTDLGAPAWQLGAALSLTLLAGAAAIYAIRRPSEKYGMRPVFWALSGLLTLSSALFLLSSEPWLAVLAAMAACLSAGEGESGAFFTLEQVAISRAAPAGTLSTIFSFYQLTGYLAAGAGAACVGNLSASPDVFFWMLLAASIFLIFLYSFVDGSPVNSPGVLAAEQLPPWVKRVAWLFALDSFAGGFVALSLVIFWLYTRFQMEPAVLGMVSFGAQAAAALSFLIAGPVSRKIGLVPAMVSSHLISNIFLIGVAFAPSASTAVALLLARYLLSQIDVPIRHAFLMSAVRNEEREGVASLTNMSRILAKAASPVLAGSLFTFSMSAPFLLGGFLKILYDLMLYKTIRHIPERAGE